MSRDRWWKFQARAAPYLFVAPFVVIFCVFILYPLARSLDLSFHKTFGAGHAIFIGAANYRFLLAHDLLFWLAVLNTAAYTLVFLAIEIPLSLGLAILLNSREVRLRNLFRFAFFSSYVVGQVFVGVIFNQLFGNEGLVNRCIGIVVGRHIEIGWLTSANLAMPTVVIASLWLGTGLAMVYFLAAIQAVDRDLYEAAEIDGAGRWGRLVHVTLPGIRPVMTYLILIGVIGGFQLFELPFVLLQGAGPGGRGLTIVMYLFLTGFGGGDLGYAAAIGWVLALILVIATAARVPVALLRKPRRA
jgi:ABC-type sugar transport system permease subunit